MFSLLATTAVAQGGDNALNAIAAIGSAVAAFASLAAIYFNLRKKDELIFRVIDLDREYDRTSAPLTGMARPLTVLRLSISNSGSTQFIIDTVTVVTASGGNSSNSWMKVIHADGLPFVVVPGEIVLLPVHYSFDPKRTPNHPDEFGWNEGITVRVTAHSARGKRYEVKKQLMMAQGVKPVDAFYPFYAK